MGNSASSADAYKVHEQFRPGEAAHEGIEMATHPRKKKLGDISATNPTFGRTLERFKTRMGGKRPSAAQVNLDYSSRLLELVKEGELDQLLGLLQDAPKVAGQPSPPDQVILQCPDNNSGWTALHYAAKDKSPLILEALLNYCGGGSTVINSRTADCSSTPLHIAVQWENLECVKVLLMHQYVDLNAQDTKGSTPLHHACRRGCADIFVALAKQEATRFDVADLEHSYPLHIAVEEHHANIFKAIKETPAISERFAAQVDLKMLENSEGNTLLHIAVDSKYPELEIIDWCIEAGFDIKAGNHGGFNPLHKVAKRGDRRIATALLKREKVGGDVVAYVNSRSRNNTTPIYTAAKFNQPKMIEFLKEQGADVDSKNASGFTPLIAAIRYTNEKCVEKLLEHNADLLSRSHKRHLSALLWAVEAQNPCILRAIIRHANKTPQVAKQMWKERDPGENTAHHLAARASNLDILETLVHYDGSCLEERNKNGCTPFHVAVKEGKLAIVNYIISNAQNSTYTLDGRKSSGLHLAAENGHQAVVERLVKLHDFGLSVSTRNADGWTPIHLSAKNGHHSVLEFLLEQSPVRETMEIIDNEQATALYLACKNGHRMCVEILLKQGAMVTYVLGDSESGRTTKSCLEAAIDNDHQSVVLLILQSAKWKQSLQFCGNTSSRCKDIDTPLRKLIKKMPSMANVVFDNCITDDRLTNEEEDSYYYEKKYNYEFLEDFNNLFADGGPKFEPDHLCKCPNATDNGGGSEVIGNQGALLRDEPPRPLPPTLSSSALRRQETEGGHTVQPPREHVAQRFGDDKLWGPAAFDYRDHPLSLMIHHHRQELLKHPLVASFIHYKWNLFGKYMYYPNILMYTLLMLMLTIYTHIHFSYARELAAATNRTLSECSMVEELNQTLQHLIETDPEVGQPLLRKKKQLIVWAVLIILMCVMRLGLEIGQVIHHRCDYFISLINYLEGFLYVATIVFVSNFQLNCLTSWRWQLGALCIFLSWWNFILFLSQQPTVGIYVVMFQHIMKTFLHIAPMSILLILAFGQPFFMLLSPVVADDSTQPFFDFPYSLLKTLTMTVGEFETDPLFYSVPNIITYPVVTYFLWIVFLIIMPVLLQNMLVGLAVDDIKGVQEKAALKKEALQIEFILDVLSRIPKPIIRWGNRRNYTRAFGKGNCDKFLKWITGRSWNPELKSNRLENNIFLRLDRLASSLDSMEHRLHGMAEQGTKLETMVLHLAREQERYLEPARQHLFRHRRSSSLLSQSQPSLVRLEHFDEEDGEAQTDSLRPGGVQFAAPPHRGDGDGTYYAEY